MKKIGFKIANWYLLRKFEDASYHPSQDDEVPANLDELSPQDNIPSLKISDEFSYTINFGQNRAFTNGTLEVFYNNSTYRPNHPEKRKRLKLIRENTEQRKTNLGKAETHIFIWEIPNTSFKIKTEILMFPSDNYCIFQVTLPNGLKNCNTNEFSDPIIKFPLFQNESLNERLLTFKDETFCPPTKRMPSYASAPICLFDDQKNSVIFSALNDFATNIITASKEYILSYNGVYFKMGPDGLVKKIPENYTYGYVFVFQKGISQCFQEWGDVLHRFYNLENKKIDPYENLMNSHLGYFTDNGAYYYYFPINKGEGTPFAYYHLDSWWYEKKSLDTLIFERKKDGSTPGGCLRWEPDDKVWSIAVENLSEKLNNKPLTAHSRWFNEETPYKEKFDMIIEDGWAMPTTLEFWEFMMDITDKYNIFIYEQDWMQNQFDHFTHLKAEIGAHRNWLEDMNKAAASHDKKIQYCMATPAQVMEAINLSNVINIRNTDDYQSWKDWKWYYPDFTQNALLLKALRLWPFLDVFFSGKHNSEYAEEPYPELRALMSTLGGGPVAVGDPIGKVDKDVIDKIIRKDGLIYKPDYPIKAPDLMFIKHNTCYVAYTESKHQDLSWYYVVNFALWPEEIKSDYTLKEMDITGDFVEYDWFKRSVKVRNDEELISFHKEKNYQYCIYAPLLSNGVALIGDPKKYVTMSSKEFNSVIYNESSIKIQLSNIKEEMSEILLYSPKKPEKITINNKNLEKNMIKYGKNLLSLRIEFQKTSVKEIIISFKEELIS